MAKVAPYLVGAMLVCICATALKLAATSPQLEWRDPMYIAAGFAGVIGMVLMLIQPLLAGGLFPKLSLPRARTLHRWIGGLLVLAVLIHVGGLWITSPPDVIDALLFASPTPFSVWGVIAMWAIFAAALMAALRKRLKLRPAIWRLGHTLLVSVVVVGTVVHALLIQGTMETISKWALALVVGGALVLAVWGRKVWIGVLRS